MQEYSRSSNIEVLTRGSEQSAAYHVCLAPAAMHSRLLSFFSSYSSPLAYFSSFA